MYTSEPLTPPTVLTILEITSSSLTVSWRPPLGQFEEENTIHYLVNVTDTKGKSVVNKVNSTVLSIRVPELLPDHVYQVAVAAVSGERVGPSTTPFVKTNPATGVYIVTSTCLHLYSMVYSICNNSMPTKSTQHFELNKLYPHLISWDFIVINLKY